jgi:hypothetical protein
MGALCASSEDGARAACARVRVGRLLVDVVASDAHPAEARAAAAEALEAHVAADPAPNAKKVAWSGGVEALIAAMSSGIGDLAAPALRLLSSMQGAHPHLAVALCNAAAIAAISAFVSEPNYAVVVQAVAAELLAAISAVPEKTDTAEAALTDHALPRSCEVLHQGTSGAVGNAERRLSAACAEIVCQLVCSSRLCCHVVIFHTAVLRPAVAALVAGRRCGLAQKLLKAAAAFAADPGDGLVVCA